ncbi:MAG: hypothetical protein AB1938_10695 [Myxococcota bacterium]
MRRLALALFLAGCGGRGDLYAEALAPLPLVATGSAVVQVVPQTRRAVVLTPGEATPGALVLSTGARLAARVPGSELVAVLSGSPREPKLELLDVTTGAVDTLEAPGFFDTITWSPDGRFGVLAYASAAPSDQLVARNLNEVGLLSVAGRTVTRLQLDTESLAPRGVVFGPAEQTRQLVAVLLERGVAVFDALRPDVAPRRISLRPPGSTFESTVVEAVFARSGRWLFLRASNLDDVIVVELGPEVGAPVSASINFVAGGHGLTDIEAPPEALGDMVLAVFAASRDVWLLDAHGIQDNAKRLAMTSSARSVSLLSGDRALLWDGQSPLLTAWDLSDGRTGTVELDGAFASPLVVPALDKAVFPVPAAAGGAALSTVTVVEETNRLRLKLQSIQLAKPFTTAAFDPLTQRLFFTVSSSATVVTMDLRTLQLAEVTLDGAAVALHYLPAGDWLVAEHSGNPLGDLTVLPAGTTERSSARRYRTFAFTDDFDRPGDAP